MGAELSLENQILEDYGSIRISKIGAALQLFCMRNSFDQLINLKQFQLSFEGVFGRQVSYQFQQYNCSWGVSGLEVFCCLYLLCEGNELPLDDKLDALIALVQFNPTPELVVNNFVYNQPQSCVLVDEVKLMFQCVVYGIHRLAGKKKLPTVDAVNYVAEQFFTTPDGFTAKQDWLSMKYRILGSRPVCAFLEQIMSVVHVPTLTDQMNLVIRGLDTTASYAFGHSVSLHPGDNNAEDDAAAVETNAPVANPSAGNLNLQIETNLQLNNDSVINQENSDILSLSSRKSVFGSKSEVVDVKWPSSGKGQSQRSRRPSSKNATGDSRRASQAPVAHAEESSNNNNDKMKKSGKSGKGRKSSKRRDSKRQSITEEPVQAVLEKGVTAEVTEQGTSAVEGPALVLSSIEDVTEEEKEKDDKVTALAAEPPAMEHVSPSLRTTISGRKRQTVQTHSSHRSPEPSRSTRSGAALHAADADDQLASQMARLQLLAPKQKCLQLLNIVASSTSPFPLDQKELQVLDSIAALIAISETEFNKELFSYVSRSISAFNIVSGATSNDNHVAADQIVPLIRLCFQPKVMNSSFKYADDGPAPVVQEEQQQTNEERLIQEIGITLMELNAFRQRQQEMADTLRSFGYSQSSMVPSRPKSSMASTISQRNTTQSRTKQHQTQGAHSNPNVRSFAASIMAKTNASLSRRNWLEIRLLPQLKLLHGIADTEVVVAPVTETVSNKLQLYWDDLVGNDILIYQSRILEYVKACLCHRLRLAPKKIVPQIISSSNQQSLLSEASEVFDQSIAVKCSQQDVRDLIQSNIVFVVEEFVRVCSSMAKGGKSSKDPFFGGKKEAFLLNDVVIQQSAKLENYIDDLVQYVRRLI